MQEPYRYETLPLDTPDDDDAWAQYLDVFRQGFLDKRASPDGLAVYRNSRRADGATLGMVTTEGPGLDGRRPVGAFVSAPFTLNDGAGLVDALVINTIAVRPSHRRRGILKTMMRAHLEAAIDDGVALALLTASEATIYGRFGFGVANRRSDIEVDTRRLRFRDDLDQAPGSVEFVDPPFLEPHLERIRLAHQLRYRGAGGLQSSPRLLDTGAWDTEAEGPSRSLRAVVHFDVDGVPDGFATFRHDGWGSSPINTSVQMLCSPDPAIDRALWEALAATDLVERLSYGMSHPADPLYTALVDPWAVTQKSTGDAVWLRVLDLPRAVAGRGFEGDGEVVVSISDAMGYCAGTWRISVHEGRGTAVPSTSDAEVSLDISTLARIWLGDRSASELAWAGLVGGSREDVARLSRIFATVEPPVNLAKF
ncbi:GNAT family N-acetyltransferase [Tessaracoccus terricola]